MPADEILGLLRQAATAAAGCRALARCGDSSADAHSNLLEALVEALQLHGPVDAAVARHGCTALVSLCRSSADSQAHVVACGAFAAAAACARAPAASGAGLRSGGGAACAHARLALRELGSCASAGRAWRLSLGGPALQAEGSSHK